MFDADSETLAFYYQVTNENFLLLHPASSAIRAISKSFIMQLINQSFSCLKLNKKSKTCILYTIKLQALRPVTKINNATWEQKTVFAVSFSPVSQFLPRDAMHPRY